jgi:heavy metal translocating P-type ATPase
VFATVAYVQKEIEMKQSEKSFVLLLLKRVQRLFDLGRTRKAIALLLISAVTLIISFVVAGTLPVDPAWVAIALCGLPIVIDALVALVTRFDIKADLLVTLALIASLAIGEYFAAGEVALIMQFGGLLEDLTVARAQKGIQHLVEMTPRTARLILPDGTEQVVLSDEVGLGQKVRILPGESIPVDGRIISGATSINESLITGEPMPVDKTCGDEVFSGTTNQFGAIEVRATRVGKDGSIQRMAYLVKSADAKKAKIVRLADRWATWIVAGALCACVGVYILTGELIRSVTVLVVFCPCSLVLATPTAIMAAVGNATKHGFLVKEGDALERLATVRKLIFDKTGTLTEGRPQVSALSVVPDHQITYEELYSLVASAESCSEHPLGQAIVSCAKGEHIPLYEAKNFEMLPGRGVFAIIKGKPVIVGNAAMMKEQGLIAACWKDAVSSGLTGDGLTITYAAIDGKAAGIVALGDTIRPTSRQTLAYLHKQAIATVLLTGDNATAAGSVARKVGVEQTVASCRPEDKLSYIERCEKKGEFVCMVGDGINDAPALKRSYVGIAMGGVGSDVAIDAADIVMVKDGIEELPHLLALSRHMMRVIKANLTFSMGLNFVAVILAFAAVLDPVSGALVHNCGSVFVIANSSFLLTWSQRKKAKDHLWLKRGNTAE